MVAKLLKVFCLSIVFYSISYKSKNILFIAVHCFKWNYVVQFARASATIDTMQQLLGHAYSIYIY